MNLWPWAAGANEEGFPGKGGPSDVLLPGEWMAIRQGRDKGFGPNPPVSTVGKIGRPDYERDIEMTGAQLGNRLSRRVLGDLQIDPRIIITVSTDHVGEEALWDQAVDAHAQSTAFSQGRHAGSLHSMVEVFDTSRHPLDKKASGLGEPDASRVALEKKDTKFHLKRPNASADARLAYSECLGGVAKIQVLGNHQSLD